MTVCLSFNVFTFSLVFMPGLLLLCFVDTIYLKNIATRFKVINLYCKLFAVSNSEKHVKSTNGDDMNKSLELNIFGPSFMTVSSSYVYKNNEMHLKLNII